MSLDRTTKRQLIQARQDIIAQLDQLEFRVAGRGGVWRRRGPRDEGDVYDTLKNELRDINELLGLDPEDGL